jgi:hypothetical protein
LTVVEREKSILEMDGEKLRTYNAHCDGKKQRLTEICKSLLLEFEGSGK